MYNLYLGLKFSFSYFSIIPISFKGSDDLSQRDILSSMLLFLPLVGLVLGVITVGIYLLLSSLGWYGAIVSATLYMVLYGFLHTEAIIDVADALYASHSHKDPYLIIKEPTVGAMGVLYAIGAIILKISGILYLFSHSLLVEFISILVISRLTLLMLFRIYEFRSSFATQLKESLSPLYLYGAYILYSIIGTLLTPYFLPLLLLAIGIGVANIYILRAKLGFVNGDLLGATLEMVEIVLFLVVGLV
jgi:adenosylcobinamide-GDP ribazoletransferase